MSDCPPPPPRQPAPALLWGLLGALAVIAFLVVLKLMSRGGL
ncbi:hypothetical protein [Phenylobacterium sp.]|jgi:hypothetical protein